MLAALSVIMKCVYCQKDFDILNAIESSPFSWPHRNSIWYECLQCGQGSHLRFSEGKVQVIKPQGSPGYEYDVLSEISEPSIKIRVDPGYLHIWYLGKHYEVAERA